MSKTAMQELIDEMDIIKHQLWDSGLRDKAVLISDMITKAVVGLKKEKEQIIDAFDYGYHCASNGTSAEITLDGNIHYNQNFNQNK